MEKVMNSIDKFQKDAEELQSTLNISGRFSFQEEAMKLVVADVAKKLQIEPSDVLLDIGCNCGDITIPLAFLCKRVTGIDGEKAIEKLQQRAKYIHNINTISGDFFDLTIDEKYDCILIYSVLMYIKSYEEKLKFILKAARCLKSGGRLLVGDIVNTTRKERFLKTDIGKIVDENYKKKMKDLTLEDIKSHDFQKDMADLLFLDDAHLMQILYDIRQHGYEAYLLPQRHDLPFGYTRDDILIYSW